MTWLPEPFGHAPITCAPARAHASVLRIYQCAHCHDRHSELFLLTASQWPPHMEHSPVSPQASSTRQSPPSQCKDSQKKFPTMPSSHVPGQQQRSRRVNPINMTHKSVLGEQKEGAPSRESVTKNSSQGGWLQLPSANQVASMQSPWQSLTCDMPSTPARGLSGEYAIIWPQLAVVVTDGVVGAAGTGLAATAGQVWHELSQYPA